MKAVSKLQSKLQNLSSPETKSWFENYLKHMVKYRGVKSPFVKKVTQDWLIECNILDQNNQHIEDVIEKLFQSEFAEDKFAAIFILQKIVKDKLWLPIKVLKIAQSQVVKGNIFDWSTADWLAVRVTSILIVENNQLVSYLLKWTENKNLWLRRLAITSLLKTPKARILNTKAEQIIINLLPSDERFIQTGIGWYLATLSKVDHDLAKKLFIKFFNDLDQEVIDRHAKNLDIYMTLKNLKRIRTN